MKTKKCAHCHNILPKSDFYQWKNKIHSYCNKCESIRRKYQLYKYKKQCLEYKNTNCCSICGYSKSMAALEFHHKDPEQKDFNISSSKLRKFGEKTKKELDKCIVLCSNCHRELHEDKESLKFEANVNNSKRQKYYCENCNNECTYKCNRCQKCYNKFQSKNQPTKSQLQNDIQELKYFTKIGKKYGVSDNAVRKWVKKYDLN